MKFFGFGTWKPGKRIYLFYRIFGLVFLILGLVFLGMIVSQSLSNHSEKQSLLGLENCGGALLSKQEIQSICTSRPQKVNDTASDLTSYYANKFDNPDYSAGSDTLWNLNPSLIEQCQILFEEENVSGIYLDVYSYDNITKPLSDAISYSKEDIMNYDNNTKFGIAQWANFDKGNKLIFLREVAQPLNIPLTCTKDQMIQLAQIVKSKLGGSADLKNSEEDNIPSTVDMLSSFKQISCNGGDTLIRMFPGYTLVRLMTKETPNLIKFRSQGLIEDFYQMPLYEEIKDNETFNEVYYNFKDPSIESGNGTEPAINGTNVFFIISPIEKVNLFYDAMKSEGYRDYSLSTISIVLNDSIESQVISYSCKIE